MRAALVVLCVTCAVPAAAQDYPAWYARGELGATEMNGTGAPWLGARVGRAFGQGGTFALDGGVAGSSGAWGFATLTGGFEARAFARSRVSPFLRLEVGFLSDPAGDCWLVGWGAGLSFRLIDPVSLRAGLLFCDHCWDNDGPVVASVGVEYRW